jgi:hypothetical protein
LIHRQDFLSLLGALAEQGALGEQLIQPQGQRRGIQAPLVVYLQNRHLGLAGEFDLAVIYGVYRHKFKRQFFVIKTTAHFAHIGAG